MLVTVGFVTFVLSHKEKYERDQPSKPTCCQKVSKCDFAFVRD